MTKNGGRNRGTKAPGVNPQGFGQDGTFTPDPKSKLENAAKNAQHKIKAGFPIWKPAFCRYCFTFANFSRNTICKMPPWR